MIRALLLFVSLVGPLVYCDGAANELPFPKLLDRTNPNRQKIRIVSEEFHSDGSYRTAEELIDLALGKAAYIRIRNDGHYTWLVDIKDKSIYKYQPFTCERSVYNGDANDMELYDISAKLKTFSLSQSKEHNVMIDRRAGDSNRILRIKHKWSLVSGSKTTHVYFLESVNQTGDLILDSIEEYEGNTKKVTINILSLEHELPLEAYDNELQVPLIYGCKRDAGSLNFEMQQMFNILAVDPVDRHHFKAKARAMKFTTTNPTSTESVTIELALSQPRDANYNMSPVKVHMTRLRNSQSDNKTVVDHYLNVKYETNMTDGTCTISNVGTMNPQQQTNPVVLKFSDELTFNISAKVLESMLYSVSKESFMRLERSGDSIQYAYFADTYNDVFGARMMARIVRRFSLDTDGRSKLDSFAIWIFESATKLREAYDFRIFETISLASDVTSAQAFDQSRECYLSNEEALEGRDYAWFKINFSLPPERVNALRDRVDELKNTLYRLIRTKLNLSYLRIPKMEVIFSENSGNFSIKMLVLDSLPLHLVMDELKSRSLHSNYVKSSEVVSNLHDCSEFCWMNRCRGMTFSRVDHTCNLTIGLVHRDHLSTDDNADTYWIPEGKEPHLLPRLQQQIDALHSNRQDERIILGFNELNQVHPTGNLLGFGNLSAKIELDGLKVDLIPVSVQIESELERDANPEPEKMVYEDRDGVAT